MTHQIQSTDLQNAVRLLTDNGFGSFSVVIFRRGGRCFNGLPAGSGIVPELFPLRSLT